MRRRAIAQQENRNVIGRDGSADKRLDGFENGLLKLIERRRVVAGHHFERESVCGHRVRHEKLLQSKNITRGILPQKGNACSI